MRLVLTSYGLNRIIGRKLLWETLKEDKRIQEKKILLICMPEFVTANDIIYDACLHMGFQKENIDRAERVDFTKKKYDYIYVTEGNTFEVLHYMQQKGLVEYIQALPKEEDWTYIGTSAGAVIAGIDIEIALDFDRNFVKLEDWKGLQLVNAEVVPHFTKDALEKYLQKQEESWKQKYPEFIAIGNEEKVVINVGK